MKTIIVNFKQYHESTGRSAISLISLLNHAIDFKGIETFFAVSLTDLLSASEIYGDMVIAQHVDGVDSGPYTGHVSYRTLLNMGVRKSLLNHSERKVKKEIIAKTAMLCDKAGVELILCAADIDEVKMFSSLPVPFIAYEPPDLIGGNISVSTANPDTIRDAAVVCDRADKALLVGAGIKVPDDARKSVELGASGILISSGVVLSREPGDALSSLAKALL
ncbi:MAG: triose-phosphate isomerase [Candidatus Thermoplasmatota archaeon]|nr:triose-phosphate isomerase [Candidatus Thermoplasmatota archaeon]MCL5730994.1 triose-phosphate isomerase [Candidatus Thermoplasmatota archaeon]